MKKFELTTDTKMFFGRKLFRIKALISFGDVTAGDLGGYVEKEENLSHDGNAWVFGNAKVSDNAKVSGEAKVSGNAEVSGNAWVSGNAKVSGNAWVFGEARVSGNTDYLCFTGLGSCNRNTTFFICIDGHIHVSCGCFSGNLEEFETKVKETHGDSKYGKEYLACLEVVKIHFEEV